MKYAKVFCAQHQGGRINIIDVETDITRSLHSFKIVGLPSKLVDEARDRVAAAIKNSGFKSPKQKNEKVVVSLAPADLRKSSSHFDLAIALSYLRASGEIYFESAQKIFLGELSLDGKVRKVTGILPIILEARKAGFTEAFVPKENAKEASLVSGMKIYPVHELNQVVSHLDKKVRNFSIKVQRKTQIRSRLQGGPKIFNKIIGNKQAKRALIIAAAGKHNLMMYGPPGTGKTLLARSIQDILPNLDKDQIFETTSIYSMANKLKISYMTQSPFRAPHHTASMISVIGGGQAPSFGEISFAHNGALFMDEFAEFNLETINALRQILEDKEIIINRANGSAKFPADFILLATSNPCPCGYLGTGIKECICTRQSIDKYRRKLSGPVLDRIDLFCNVSEVVYKDDMNKQESDFDLEEIKLSIARVRKIQKELGERSGLIKPEIKKFIEESSAKLNLSNRAYYKIISISRTIADLCGSEEIKKEHVLEALQYRWLN